jgi:hypothetical protein
VLVASSAEILHKDQGDLWDSGPREFSTIEGVVPGDDVPLVVTMPNGSVDRVTIAIRKG